MSRGTIERILPFQGFSHIRNVYADVYTCVCCKDEEADKAGLCGHCRALFYEPGAVLGPEGGA